MRRRRTTRKEYILLRVTRRRKCDGPRGTIAVIKGPGRKTENARQLRPLNITQEPIRVMHARPTNGRETLVALQLRQNVLLLLSYGPIFCFLAMYATSAVYVHAAICDSKFALALAKAALERRLWSWALLPELAGGAWLRVFMLTVRLQIQAYCLPESAGAAAHAAKDFAEELGTT